MVDFKKKLKHPWKLTHPSKWGLPTPQWPPEQVFAYYIYERERIRFVKDVQKVKAPYTKDPILKEFKFCNIFREDDRVTRHYLGWIEPITNRDDTWNVILNTAMYRMFTWPPTLDAFGHLINTFDSKRRNTMTNQVMKVREDTGRYLTGAYIVPPGQVKGRSTYDNAFDSLEVLCKIQPHVKEAYQTNRLELVWQQLRKLPILGPFMAYEVVTDFTYNIMHDARDRYTWANAGPGALRGINILRGRNKDKRIRPDIATSEMQLIMGMMRMYYERWADEDQADIFDAYRIDMRTAEHTLCEYDKFTRVLRGEGYPRSKYTPNSGVQF